MRFSPRSVTPVSDNPLPFELVFDSPAALWEALQLASELHAEVNRAFGQNCCGFRQRPFRFRKIMPDTGSSLLILGLCELNDKMNGCILKESYRSAACIEEVSIQQQVVHLYAACWTTIYDLRDRCIRN